MLIKDISKSTKTSINSSASNVERVNIFNRKYIGSKNRLISFIKEVILKNSPNINTFFDGFAGTGCVSYHFRGGSRKIIANDILFSNHVILKTFLNSTQINVNIEKLELYIENLNKGKPHKGYAFKNYGGTYFSKHNAGKIDYIRESIENFFKESKITLQEKYVLITALILAADKVANTCGQYDAFLKHIGKGAYNKKGKHLIDSNVYKSLFLKLPIIEFDGQNEVFCEDLNALIRKAEPVDVLYLDPPYNTRQYCDNYHVLENIARWNRPVLYGKTKKFERTNIKSKYSSKTAVQKVFKDLMLGCKAKNIYLSYNSEGIMSVKDIMSIMSIRGKTKIYEHPYSIFGNGAGVSRKRHIIERIFHCQTKY